MSASIHSPPLSTTCMWSSSNTRGREGSVRPTGAPSRRGSGAGWSSDRSSHHSPPRCRPVTVTRVQTLRRERASRTHGRPVGLESETERSVVSSGSHVPNAGVLSVRGMAEVPVCRHLGDLAGRGEVRLAPHRGLDRRLEPAIEAAMRRKAYLPPPGEVPEVAAYGHFSHAPNAEDTALEHATSDETTGALGLTLDPRGRP